MFRRLDSRAWAAIAVAVVLVAGGGFVLALSQASTPGPGNAAVVGDAAGLNGQATIAAGPSASPSPVPQASASSPVGVGGGPTAGTEYGGTSNVSDTAAYPDKPLTAAIPAVPVPAGAVAISGTTAQAIQNAIAAHPSGNTNFVLSGTYTGDTGNGTAIVIQPVHGDNFYGQVGVNSANAVKLDGISFQSEGPENTDDTAADNVGFFNLTFENTHVCEPGKGMDGSCYAGGGHGFGAIDTSGRGGHAYASGWTVESSYFVNDTYGVDIGPRSLVKDNVMYHNICRGGGGGVSGTTFEHNQVIDNDLHHVDGTSIISFEDGSYPTDDIENDCGGLKLGGADKGVTIQDNLFSANGGAGDGGHASFPGPGLWMDFASGNTVDDNIFYSNFGPGVEMESSGSTSDTLKGNLFVANGSTGYAGGVFLEGASGNTIDANFIWANTSRGGLDTSIGFDARQGIVPSNNTASDNHLSVAPSGSIGGSGDTVSSPATWSIPTIAAGPGNG